MTKRILYLAHRLPYPPNKGDKIRSFNILKYLSSRHDVSLATLVDDESDLSDLSELSRLTVDFEYARIDQPLRKALSLRAIPQSRSVTVAHFYSRDLQKKVDALLEERKFDAVICSSSPTAEYLFRSRHKSGLLTGMTRIMDLIDVDSVKWRQYAERTSGPKGWVYRYEAEKLGNYEAKIYDYFHSVLTVSEQELGYFPVKDDQDKLHAVSNGVDMQFFRQRTEQHHESGQPTLVFTGMMDYWPNVEGMRWFIDDIFPLIQKRTPNVRLLVVGGRPTREVLSWAERPDIEVTGFVPDIRDYLEMADVCVAPLRVARGVQNKVLEAMAMSKAVVCSSHALEGLLVTPGVDSIGADSEAEFANAVVSLLDDMQEANLMGQQARRCVEENYSWDARLQNLEDLLATGHG